MAALTTADKMYKLEKQIEAAKKKGDWNKVHKLIRQYAECSVSRAAQASRY